MASLLTSMHPHQHGASRNGLRVRPDLPSLPKILARRGYRTAAFVGNWTLKDRISGLAEHFGLYEEAFNRKRWFGLFGSEAGAAQLTAAAVEWVDRHRREEPARPFLLWVHYVEPHAPYRFHEEYAARLSIARNPLPGDRYDTEVALVDHWVGRLLGEVRERTPAAETLVIFTADHGESLGEHGYWGHGRHLYESGLRIPLALVWPGRLAPQVVGTAAINLDVAPTLLTLLGLPVPSEFQGFDWAPVLRGTAPAPDRVTFYQAHKGAVQPIEEPAHARLRGLLEVGVLAEGILEVLRVPAGERRLFALGPAGANKVNSRGIRRRAQELADWLRHVRDGLEARDRTPDPAIDTETAARLRALGYLE
jgi:arylsulfatase A-like enzyme